MWVRRFRGVPSRSNPSERALRDSARLRFESIGSGRAGVLAIGQLPQPSVPDEIVENDPARDGFDPEEPCRLMQVERHPRHLAEVADDHRYEIGTGGLSIRNTAGACAPFDCPAWMDCPGRMDGFHTGLGGELPRWPRSRSQ